MRLLLFIFLLSTGCREPATRLLSSKLPDTLSNGLRIINRTIDSDYYYKDQVGTDSLQGNCQVYYAEDDTSYYLYLKRGDTLCLLNKSTRFTSLYYLGIVLEDEKDYFILGHDQGNGSPYTFEFIDKQSGQNVLGYAVPYLDYWTKLDNNTYVLYLDTNRKDKTLTLFSYQTQRKEHYDLPGNYRELLFDTLTKNKLKIRLVWGENGDSAKVITYRR